MLTELYVKNFAIIDDLAIPFGPGLNVLTGETGAGKSIIIEALGLMTGDRVGPDVVRSGEEEASVTAVFDSKYLGAGLISELKGSGHEVGDQLIVKRCVLKSGRSKAFINGSPVSIIELKKVSPFLLEISSQREHQGLLNEETHLELVDRFGDLYELREDYSLQHHHYMSLKDRLVALTGLSTSATKQKEYLNYQIKEIDAADLKNGEEEGLENEKNVVKHAAKLLEKIRLGDELLYSSESSVAGALDKVGELLGSAGEIDLTVGEWLPLCDQARASVEELSRHLRGYLDRLDVDPGRLEEIEARLWQIRRLKKKYGGSIEEVLRKRGELAEKLGLIENCDNEIDKLNGELETARISVEKLALELSGMRKQSAEMLSRLIQRELKTLGFGKSTFTPGHATLSVEEADETGIDRFGFLISPNPGEPVKPLARIASGGELSRIVLAIKRVLMDKVAPAALEVFDEVDVGIGGATAEIVGRKLKEMAAGRQVICITHLPQVASLGDQHIAVSKKVKERRTVARFDLLDQEGRVDEIARMLGGSKITKTTKDHALEMLIRGEK